MQIVKGNRDDRLLHSNQNKAANVSKIDVTVYNVKRFVDKSIPLAGIHKPNISDTFCFQHMLLKPYTCASWLSVGIDKQTHTFGAKLTCFNWSSH